jgi:protein-disulfide isomerase
MEHDKMDVNRWVDDRLASLEPTANWRPDSSAALALLRHRDRAGNTPRRHLWWVWATLSAGAAAACLCFLLFSTQPACANPLGCTQPNPPSPAAPAILPETPPVPAPTPAVAPARTPVVARKRNFKESGSLTAPLTCELYTDYECPHCATFYLETIPQLVAEYVQTGKVRLIHRDFPLAQHQYARLAARYANAAGQTGYYQAVATRLFRTQGVWSGDGDVDQQVAHALPAAVMAKVRALVKNDATLDDSVATDLAMALEDHLNQTPTLVIVSKGHRLVIGGYLSFSQVKTRLDELLAQQ